MSFHFILLRSTSKQHPCRYCSVSFYLGAPTNKNICVVSILVIPFHVRPDLHPVTYSCLTAMLARLHNNGRMLDVFWRLHGEEMHFFLPYDLEMSNPELNHVCRHAEQWRGEEGERRKVAVYDYVWEEEEVSFRVCSPTPPPPHTHIKQGSHGL